MRKIFLLTLLLPFIAFAQQKDVVYLKNGSVIKGNIKEIVPSESLKIETYDGSLFVFKMNEVERILKEEMQKNTKFKNNELFTKYAGFLDVSFGGKLYDMFSFDISTTHGGYISEYFFMGAGIEFDLTYQLIRYIHNGEIISQVPNYLFALPVYADFRMNPLGIQKKITPFVDLRIGCEALSPLFFLSPSAGIRFKFDKIALNVGFSYEYYATGKGGYDIHDLSAKVGIEF
ncbi:MAG: hypothetical protein IKU78_01065 [Paludibacteraceae bacterium]|nr:hypothetical protein [Paludibacteraceae bacterium]